MAIRSAWWMREPATRQMEGGSRRSSSTTHHLRPHQKWPSQGSNGLAFKELDRYLRENPGTYCSVHKISYSYDAAKSRAKWGLDKKAKSSVELEEMLLEQVGYLVLILIMRLYKCGVLICSSGRRRRIVLCSMYFTHAQSSPQTPLMVVDAQYRIQPLSRSSPVVRVSSQHHTSLFQLPIYDFEHWCASKRLYVAL